MYNRTPIFAPPSNPNCVDSNGCDCDNLEPYYIVQSQLIHYRAMPEYQNDVAVLSMIEPTVPLCSGIVRPKIQIQNNGGNPITELVFDYSIDGGATEQFTWTGNLTVFQFAEVELPILNLPTGSHELNLSIVGLNGNTTDENAANDVLISTIVYGSNSIFFNLNTDFYAEETTMEITDEDGNVLYTGSGYSPLSASSEEICLEPGCYTLTVFDAYGDGLTDGQNTGNFVLVDDEGTVLVPTVTGNFGSQSSNNFCIEAVGTYHLNPNYQSLSIQPNPSTGVFTINFDFSNVNKADLFIYDTTGKLLKSFTNHQDTNLDVSDLPSGIYMLSLVTDDRYYRERLVIVE